MVLQGKIRDYRMGQGQKKSVNMALNIFLYRQHMGVLPGPPAPPPPPPPRIVAYSYTVSIHRPWGGEGPGPPFRKLCAPVCPSTILGIDFYSGFRRNVQGGGGQLEILKNPSIDFYSGFRKKNSRLQFEILKKIQV